MKKEKKNILEFLRSLFRKEEPTLTTLPDTPSAATVERLINRTLDPSSPADLSDTDSDGEEKSAASVGKGNGSDKKKADNKQDPGDKNPENNDADKKDADKKKESCPYATKRAIVESIAEIRRFAAEHKLAASVLKALLALLAEIALGALRGKISRQVLETLLHAINYELDMEEAFRKGHEDGRKKLIEERYPSDDDGLPHINGTLLRPDTTSIFDVAAEARR